MTVSPNKHSLTVPSSTANRGVEAKEIEIVNINLGSASGEQRCGRQAACSTPPSPPLAPAPAPPRPTHDDTASYIQVLVQKQRRRQDALTAPRMPRPSSPICVPYPNARLAPSHSDPVKEHLLWSLGQTQGHGFHVHADEEPKAYTEMKCAWQSRGAWREAPLTCPATGAMHHSCEATQATEAAHERSAHAGRPRAAPPSLKRKLSLWRRATNIASEDLESSHSDGPERLDVYRFESGVASLSARGAAPTRLERAVRRRARPAALLLRELVTAPRLAAALPAALLVLALRTVLITARDAALGLVQAMSDYALKPALVVSFNALLRPVLVFAAQTACALRETLRPLSMALDEATAPAARLLAAVRLVHVERRCGCTHAQHTV